MDSTIDLPAEIPLQLLAEGAANIVYRLELPVESTDGTSTPPIEADLHTRPNADSRTTPPPTIISPSASPDQYKVFRNHLLRLHKDVGWLPPTAELAAAQSKLINPLFPPSHLTSQLLTSLPPGLIQSLNATLKQSERAGTRPEKRHGLYLDEAEPHGLLVQDMSPSASRGEVLVEVKPKWLMQSPTAPKGSRRCRTCALRAMRAKAAKDSGKAKLQTEGWCPFDLGSGEKEGVERAVKLIVKGLGSNSAVSSESEEAKALEERMVEFFVSTPILSRLRELQASLDPEGVLALPDGDEENVPEQFLVATTIRDCTLFVRAANVLLTPSGTEAPTNSIEGRLGDLDLKAPEAGKLAYWKGQERSLIEGGWYEAKDGAVAGCRLERS